MSTDKTKGDVGRPSKLTDELLSKIKELILEGKKESEIYTELEIPRSTWTCWKFGNYTGFHTFISNWRREYKLNLAENVSEEILEAISLSEEGKIDIQLLNLKQKEAQFLRETLGKDSYSKRTEVTGKDGEAITIIFDEAFKSKLNAITPKTTGDSQEFSEI